MSARSFKGWFGVVLAVIVLAAALVFELTNLENRTTIHVYTRSVPEVSLALIMLLAAVAGVILYLVLRMLFHSIGLLMADRREKKVQQRAAEKAAEETAKREEKTRNKEAKAAAREEARAEVQREQQESPGRADADTPPRAEAEGPSEPAGPGRGETRSGQ